MNSRNITLFLITILNASLLYAADKDSSASIPSDSANNACQQAQEEMAAIKTLQPLIDSSVPSKKDKDNLETIYKRAFRAWMLDPQNENAAYYACMAYGNLIYLEDKDSFFASGPSAIELINKYFENFAARNSAHYYRICQLNSSLTNKMFKVVKKAKKYPNQAADIYKYGHEMIYALTRQGVWELQNQNKCMSTGFTAIFDWHYAILLPVISADKLEDEFKFWMNYYDKVNIDRLVDKYNNLPKRRWGEIHCSREFLEAAYYAKMGKVDEAKRKLESAARKYNKSDRAKWGGSYNSGIRRIMSLAKKESEKNWRPENGREDKDQKFLDAMVAFFKQNNPIYKGIMPKFAEKNLTIIPARQIMVPSDIVKEIMSKNGNTYPKLILQPLGDFGNYKLFIAPTVYTNDGNGLLYTALNNEIEGKVNVAPKFQKIDFPVNPEALQSKYTITDYLVRNPENGKRELWVASAKHGICVLLQKADNQWSGYWYDYKKGLPQDLLISAIYSARHNGTGGILVSCRNPKNNKGRLYFIKPESRKLVFIKAVNLPCRIYFADGTSSIVQGNRPMQWGEKCVQTGNSLQDFAAVTDSKVLETNDLATARYMTLKAPHIYYSYFCKLSGFGNKFLQFNPFVSIYDANKDLGRLLFRGLGYSIDTDQTKEGMFGLPVIYDTKVPIRFFHGMAGVDGRVVFVTSPTAHHTIRKKDLIYIWAPGPNINNLLEDDKWYGPFVLPNKKAVVSMTADNGKLWAVDNSGVIWEINVPDALSDAASKGNVFSTAEWNKRFSEYLKRNWRLKTFYHIGREELKQAELFLDSMLKATNLSSAEYDDILFFKAAVYSRQPEKRRKASEIYSQVFEKSNDPAVKYFAQKNLAVTCMQCKQYELAIENFKKLPKIPKFSSSNIGIYCVALEYLQGPSADYYLREIDKLIQKSKK